MLLELLIIFLKLGTFTIGGGIAMLPLLQHSLVDEKKWYTNEEFVDIVTVCQSLPGIIAINMATYVGYNKKGFIGSLVATIGVIFPSFLIILVITKGIEAVGASPIMGGAMAGLRAAALGMVFVSLIQMGSKVLKSKTKVLAAVISFALVVFLKINTVYVIFIFFGLGIASALVANRRIKKNGGGESK